MHRATFRIEAPDPFADATADADVTVEVWCNDHRDLLHLRGPDAGATLDGLADTVALRDDLREDGAAVAITERCLRESFAAVDPHLERHDCLLVPPLVYEGGARHLRTLALDPVSLTGLYRDLGEEWTVDVLATHSVTALAQATPAGGVADLDVDLTDRRREAFARAYEGGYYEIPRGTTTAEVAAAMGVDRRTAEEHLRRAENRVVAALFER